MVCFPIMHHGWNYWITQLITVLSFSCSCLVSSSPSEVGQFNFECCLVVQEISSAIHNLPCFGSGLLLYLFTGSSALGVYFFAPPPFSGTGCVTPTLSAVCFSVLWGSLVLDAALWLKRSALWSTTFPAFGSGLLPAHSQYSLLFLCLFADAWHWINYLLLPLSLVCLLSVNCLLFSFVEGISVDRGVLNGAWCSPLCSVNWHSGRFGASSCSGKKWHQIFSV
jgi:hypothetical protein